MVDSKDAMLLLHQRDWDFPFDANQLSLKIETTFQQPKQIQVKQTYT